MLGWVVRSFISSHGDFTRESLELLCTTALDVVLLSRDDRFAQVRHLSPNWFRRIRCAGEWLAEWEWGDWIM